MRTLLRSTVITLLASTFLSCAATRPPHQIAAQFKYRVAFEPGTVEATEGNRIEVTEVWGTRKRIEIGGEYVVVGRYTLASDSPGWISYFLTANNWDNSGPTMDLQRMDARPGSGTFVLQHKMEGPGRFHVSLYDGWKEVADMYFGNAVEPRASGETDVTVDAR